MDNRSTPYYFLLLKFSDSRDLQILCFLLFLTLYLTTITGNLLIIIAIAFEHRLHTPMYFFMMNLATMDLGSISVTIPKSMLNSLLNARSISYFGCVAQVFFLTFFLGSDFALLTAMAHDRYVAICNPLRYETIMTKEACVQMTASVWISGLLYGVLHTSCTFAISFCSNVVDQYFCEIPHLLKLSYNDLVEVTVLAFVIIVVFLCFIFIIASYVQIFTAVLQMTSVQGRQKAFSTCIPHLIIVSLFIFSAATAYLRPSTNSPSELDLVFAVLYAVVPPMINPFIYSMRNKEVKTALWKLISLKYFSNSFLLQKYP
uniref:G-protein coupled receptors family 1 profile domain-containing protein n=1 Tax=Salvator merianae TaxID=96440 RepID=A0A8D0AVB0_SALMN